MTNNAGQKDDVMMQKLRSVFVFTSSGVVAAVMCNAVAELSYVAPFMATAAVLANAGTAAPKTVATTLLVYLVCIMMGALGYALLLPTAVWCLLLCAVVFLFGVMSKQQHPPALALLAVIFLRQPDISHSIGLLGTAVAVALTALAVHHLTDSTKPLGRYGATVARLMGSVR